MGDTSSICLSKQDTAVMYSDITLVEGTQPGYYLAGMGYDVSKKDKSDWFTIFTKVDTNNNVLWERIFVFDFTYYACTYKAFTMQDGSLMFCCNPGVFTDFFIFKISSTGDSLWYKYFNGDESGRIWDITNGPQANHYWLYSEGSFNPSGAVSCTRLTLDSSFTILGHINLPEWFRPPFNAMKCDGNEVLLCGTTEISHPVIDTRYYISGYKLEELGNIQNQVVLTNPDTVSRAAEYSSINFVDPSAIYIGGTHNFQGFWGQNPSWILASKLDDTLGLTYEKYIGGDEVYTLNSVVATNDGGVVLIGTKRVFGSEPYFRNGFFIKLDSTSGPVSIPEESNLQLKQALLYPNPGGDKLHLRTALKNVSFRLFDQNGQVLFSTKINQKTSSFNVSQLPAATYLWQIIDETLVIESGKWVKSK
jgi:hypothetical protein